MRQGLVSISKRLQRCVSAGAACCMLAALTGSMLVPPTVVAGTIFGSGFGVTPAAGARDAHWQVVALPTPIDNTPPDQVPYAAYVASAVPNVWLGGDTNAGGGGGKWITPNFGNGAASPSFPATPTYSGFPFGNWQPYSWVAAQTFTIEADDVYDFDFYGTGDDYMRFFVNGTVQDDPPAGYEGVAGRFPSIVGGTQILSAKPAETITPSGVPFGPDGQPSFSSGAGTSGNGDYGELTRFTGSLFLSAGTHTAYMVLSDQGGDSGALIGTSTFNAVPEPASIALAALAGVVWLGVAARRRFRLL